MNFILNRKVCVKIYSILKYFVFTIFLTLTTPLTSSTWTAWTEDSNDPIYNPIPFNAFEDYFPYVVFNENSFDGNGVSALYKMWHQGSSAGGSIATSYSNDGINWTLLGETNIPSPTTHPVVLYDKNGFGVAGKPYRIWYWTGVVGGSNADVIQFSQSNNGLTWDPPVAITQSITAPIAIGISGDYFYHLYGPGFVIYNPSASSVPGQPYTFPYVMFFDTATESPSISIPSTEQIGLAYSSDGIFWTRYGSEPVLIPPGNNTDWDGQYVFRPSVFKTQGVYHMFYSGSNGLDSVNTIPYAHGIGHASSTDGTNWVRDSDNPIFIYSDGVAWRNSRTYTPFVLFNSFCDQGKCPTCFAKMWFTGGSGIVAGANQGIGYATLPCPPLPQPLPPSDFVGIIEKNKFLTETEHILKAKWNASPSANVVLYRIYKKGHVVKEILASSPLVFITYLRHCSANGYEIVAVNSNNIESNRVKLRIVGEEF